jgi:hypothetical protein
MWLDWTEPVDWTSWWKCHQHSEDMVRGDPLFVKLIKVPNMIWIRIYLCLVPVLSQKNRWILALNLPRTGLGLYSIRNHAKSFSPYPLRMFVTLLKIWERNSPSMWISWSEGRAQCFSSNYSRKDIYDVRISQRWGRYLLLTSQKRIRRMMTTTVDKRSFDKKKLARSIGILVVVLDGHVSILIWYFWYPSEGAFRSPSRRQFLDFGWPQSDHSTVAAKNAILL